MCNPTKVWLPKLLTFRLSQQRRFLLKPADMTQDQKAGFEHPTGTSFGTVSDVPPNWRIDELIQVGTRGVFEA